MKLTSIIALFFITFLANPAHAYQNPRWSKLDAKTLGNLVRDTKEILREGESNQLFSQVKTQRYFNLFFENAFAAETAYDCFFGGWPSQLKTYGGKRYCTNPKGHPDYPASQCKEGELACNPILFGPDHCVSNITSHEKSTSFSNCEAQFRQGDGNYNFLKDLSPQQAKTLDDTLSMVRDVCEKGTIGTQKSTQMCANFLRKVDRLVESQTYKDRANIQDADPNAGTQAGTQSGDKTDLSTPSPSSSPSGSPATSPTTSPSATPVTPAATVKKAEDCCTTPSSPKNDFKSISEITEAMKNAPKNVVELYQRLEQKYKASPLCKIQNTMTSEEKMMNAIAHYTTGLHYIVESGGGRPEDFRAANETPDVFVQRTVKELGLDERVNQEFAKIKDADAPTKRAFKYSLTRKILDKLKNDPQAQERALEGTLADRNMKNCTFVSFDVFEKAMKGYEKLKGRLAKNKKGIVTMVDYTLPYAARRLFTIDVDKEETLFNTWCASGGANGAPMAKDGANPLVSNEPNSFKSAPGFAITGEKFKGKWGQSLRLDGVDGGNSNMRSPRAILLHPWPEIEFTPYNQYKAYYTDLPKRVNQLIAGQVSGDPNQIGAIDSILNGVETQVGLVRVQYTDGCLGIPQYELSASMNPSGSSGNSALLLREAVSDKSLIFQYSGKDQKSQYY
jgi:hypothetical protein